MNWQIQIPAHDLDLTVVPVIDHQEHTHAFTYWEEAMRYLEMTGY